MSTRYKHGDVVPNDVICARLRKLSKAVTEGRDAVRREFTMRVPAELDRDADLVLSTAADRIAALEAENARLREALRKLLLSRDVAWTGGHDWAEAIDDARRALEDKGDG